MHVIDLTPEHVPLYCVCLEDWSSDMREAGDHKRSWYEHMRERGLGVKLALDDQGAVGGMIQYAPARYAPIEGPGFYFVYCIWVHGHREGRGDFQGRGLGTALLEAAEADIRARGAAGVAAWGLLLPFWMQAAWFKRHGYRKAHRVGMQVLVWKPFRPDAQAPRWLTPRWTPRRTPGKVTVTSFIHGACPAQNLAHERAKRAAAEFPAAAFEAIRTAEPASMRGVGLMDALFIDGKAVRTGPPPSYASIRGRIAKRVRRLGMTPD